ncbi:1,5-anhydro-D-fructose reductase-like, partial [Penaeus monodon]|uniref:1,5-anhydro-D-fructose reductase-like n=1 Tax=Penaeus monodon TaxID=6687 RepID=UPI0018A771DF
LARPAMCYYIRGNFALPAGCRIQQPPPGKFTSFHQQKELRALCHKHNLHDHAAAALQHPAVTSLAARLGRTPAQVLLRHLVQRGVVVVPKSSNPERLRQNLRIFDFKLSDEDMRELDGLDRGRDGKIFIFKNVYLGIENHPEFPFHIPF